jgi:hypothetical protein
MPTTENRKKSEELPGKLDQLATFKNVVRRHGLPLGEVARIAGTEFNTITVKWENEDARKNLLELNRVQGGIRIDYATSNEILLDKSLYAINVLAKDTQDADLIAGGGTIPMRLISEVQKVSKSLNKVKIVDKDPKALLHFERHVEGYNECHLPVYYVAGEGGMCLSHNPEEAIREGHNIVEVMESDGKITPFPEIIKWQYNPKTRITLVENEIQDEISKIDGSKPEKRFFYFSTAPCFPQPDGLPSLHFMKPAASQLLLHEVAENKAVKEGSLVLLYPFEDATNAAILRKEGEMLRCVNRTCKRNLVWSPHPDTNKIIGEKTEDLTFEREMEKREMERVIQEYGGSYVVSWGK